ncbi:MAG: hypothetical protein ACE5KG_01425, partial [Nitrososphaerales archaeon]
KSGRVIIKLDETFAEGSILLDNEGRKICKLTELIGPKSSPYASSVPLTDRIRRSLGKEVYMA